MRVLITGASGFLGGHVLEATKAAGHETVVLARRTSNLSYVKDSIDEIRYGAIEDLGSVREAMKGIDAVIHCAGAVRHVAPYRELYTTNVTGTRNVTVAAAEGGAGKIIYASSMGVMGLLPDENDGGRIRDKYCRSKAEAEKAFFDACKKYGIEGVALRPGVIYGPRDFTAAYHWFRMAEEGEIFLIGDGNARFPLVYIDDLVRAFMEALKRDDLSGEKIPIQGDEEATLGRVMQLVCEEMGIDFRPRYINYATALSMARLSEFRSFLTGYRKPARLSTFVVRLFGIDHPPLKFDYGKYGLRFSTPLKEGISRTAEWYRSLNN